MKVCIKCFNNKSDISFNKESGNKKDGLKSWCKSCNKERSKEWRKENATTVKERNANYRLTNADKAKQAHKEWRTTFPKKRKASKVRAYWPHLSSKEALAEYNKLFLNQGGCCAACERHQKEFKRALAVDHCHKTGKVRGLLCGGCNTCLGHVKDSVDLLNVLANYLKEHL